MPTVHTMPNDGKHTASLSCWCCPVAQDPDTLAEVGNTEAALRESLNEPLHVIHNRATTPTENGNAN